MTINQSDLEQRKTPNAGDGPTLLHPEKVVATAVQTNIKPLQSDISGLIYELRQEHRDMDQAIAALNNQVSVDHIRVGRLKKRKLYLKDQIAYWESRQIPDLNA